MNLIKLFNVAYLKENIKKSKGFILLFLILVPLFTALVTILTVTGGVGLEVFETGEVAIVNLLGMYVIPVVLSFSLFGYVYKKNSVDFINSMPLNRKTIFVTNTIGGIILITLMQFLTAVILVVCNAVFADLIIFSKMISDIFLLMWVSYVFVFVATNLAMTFSGTFLTQVALTMLILFLVPFCLDSFNDFSNRTDYSFVNGESQFSDRVYQQEVPYTMPYRLFSILVTGSSSEIYSNNSIIRMVVLGILYFGIGIYLFQRRKMEDTEESFSSIKMHIFVKALTIFPMIIILNLLEPDIEFIIFALALIGVYYFIFDFVVKRKVIFKVSMPSLIGILIFSQVICMGAEFIRDRLPEKKLNKDDVKAVSIGNCRSYKGGSWYYYRDLFYELGYYFENQEIIDLLFESGEYVDEMYSEEIARKESASLEEKVIVTKEIIPETAEYKSVIEHYESYEPTTVVSVIFKTKTGQRLQTDLEILQADFDKIIVMLENDEDYVNAVKERFADQGVFTIQNILCDAETQENIKNEIRKKLEKMPLKEIYTTLKNTNDCAVYQYYYENHMLITNTVSITITEELFNLATEIINKQAAEKVKKALEEDVYTYVYIDIPEAEGKRIAGSTELDEKTISNFILENVNEKVDFSEKYYILRGNIGKYGSIYFYTNKVDEINKMVEKTIFDSKIYYDVVY